MSQDRTEAPTPRRRQKAREEGQVARSTELVSCAVLLAALWGAGSIVPRVGQRLSEYLVDMVTMAQNGNLASEGLVSLASGGLRQAGLVAGPLMGLLMAVAFASNALQVGVHFTTKLVAPKWTRVDPVQGLQRLLGARSAVELAKSLAKMAIVATSGWMYVRGHHAVITSIAGTAPERIGPTVGELAYGMTVRMVGTLAVVAAIDYAWQRWQFERQLRMTRQEVRDEMRDTEGNPDVRARQRQILRQLARRRMMAEVPHATVVVTNPTHFALALKYALGQHGAPTVVAKGQDLVAQRIRELAADHGVPVVENPPLARALYKTTDIGEQIPPDLYRAVAEVLAVVMRLSARQVAQAGGNA